MSGRKVDLNNLMQAVESREGSGPARVALVGCGTFVQRTYLPLLKKMREKIQVMIVWSRTLESARKVADFVEEYEGRIEILHGNEGFEHLLKSDVEACLVALPVQVQLEYVRRILRAGKHVLQEKPIGSDMDSVLEALEEYVNLANAFDGKLIWGIEENYRFEESFLHAESLIKMGGIGEILKCVLNVDNPMNSKNIYFSSPWRKDKLTFPGGFMLDSSVHFVAGLRKVVGLEIHGHVFSLCTSSKGSDVPVPTTLCGVMMLGTTGEHSDSIPCSVSITMASAIHKFQLSVTGTRGTLHVERDGPGYIVSVIEEGMKEVTSRFDFCGVERALSLFSSKVRIGRSESRCTLQDLGSLSPFEGALDLAFIQSLIQANEEDLTKRVLRVREKYDAKL